MLGYRKGINMRIQILISRVVTNKKPKDELDQLKLMRRLVPSWNKMPAWAKKKYDKKLCLLFEALAYNKTLIQAVKQFRKQFDLGAEGISFKQHEDLICRVEQGPIYKFDRLPHTSETKYRKEQAFIERFVKDNVVLDPFKIHLQTIFYAGFVDLSSSMPKPLFCSIPDIPRDTTGTVFQYRHPVAILINSRDLTRAQVKKLIDEKWPSIQHYLREHPFMIDVPFLEEPLAILALKKEGKTAREILAFFDQHNVLAGLPANYHNSDASIRKAVERAKKEIDKLIYPRKK